MSAMAASDVNLAPWVQPSAVEALAAALRRAVPEARRYRLCGAAAAAWLDRSDALDGLEVERFDSVAAAAAGSPADVLVVCSPDALPDSAAGEEAFAAAVAAAAPVALVATVNPAGASGRPGRWPAYWADRFAGHGRRLVDGVRAALWHDSHIGPDVKEGALLFVADGVDVGPAAAPLAVLHPHRQTETLRAFEARLDRFRQELAERADGLGGAETVRAELRAAQARVAALDRRLTVLVDRALAPTPAPSDMTRALVGRITGRSGPAPSPVADPVVAALFDPYHYLEANPEVDGPPLEHYLRHGEAQGRRPNPWFDPAFYLAHNPDVAAAGMSPLGHYARFGGMERRAASAEFDTAWYVATYPEVALSGLHPMLHFVAIGASLGYAGSPAASPTGGPAYPEAPPVRPSTTPAGPAEEGVPVSESVEPAPTSGGSLWGTYVGNGRVLALLRTGGHVFLSSDDLTLMGDLLRDGGYDLPFTRFLERTLRPDSTFVDVGANVGLFSVIAGRLLWDGRVVAYEVAPRPAALLRDNVAANWLSDRVTVRTAAVGAAAGSATFRFPATMHTLGSLDLDVASFGAAFPGVDLVESTVPVVRLDDDLDQLGVTGTLDLVKVDVEGGEADVLRGMAGLVAAGRVARLTLEVRRDVQVRNRGAASWDDLVAELRRLAEHGGRFAEIGDDGVPRPLGIDAVAGHGIYSNLLVTFPVAGDDTV